MVKKRAAKETRAKYAAKKKKITVSIDPGQLQRAPIILKRNGETIGAVISTAEYFSFKEWKETRATNLPPQLLADEATFKRMLPELLRTHLNKWVAVYKGQIVESADNIRDLSGRVYKELGYRAIYMNQVTEKPRVHRMLSPRVVR